MNALKERPRTQAKAQPAAKCHHCGEPIHTVHLNASGHTFCCDGCRTVYEILEQNNLCTYYNLNTAPGHRQDEHAARAQAQEYAYLDTHATFDRLVSYADDTLATVVLDIPSMHCSSCIYLLENLHRLCPGVQRCEVNFARKSARITFLRAQTGLAAIVATLHRIGYPPLLTLDADKQSADARARQRDPETRSLVMRLGVAGFCLGNIMLLSFPDYLAPGEVAPGFERLFAYLSLALAVPLLFYSGWPYLSSAYKGLRAKHFSIDLPLAIGMIAMTVRSTYEIVSGTGMGYFDSLAGLIFFLLVGRLFQHKTYAFLSFERDYKSYFPLAVRVVGTGGQTENLPLNELRTGHTMDLRTGELVPADAILTSDEVWLDNAFLTGESAPVRRTRGQLVYAGGRLAGGRAQLVVQKPVSQSTLTTLWNHPAFRKRTGGYTALINAISRYFTMAVVVIATGTLLFWLPQDVDRAFRAFTTVLIIACPCALAFAAPFTFGHLMRIFGKQGFYLKHAEVVEQMAALDTLVLDKTGTLTQGGAAGALRWFPQQPNNAQLAPAVALAGCSAHPLSRALRDAFVNLDTDATLRPFDVCEKPGVGLAGTVGGHAVRIGRPDFCGVDALPEGAKLPLTYIAIDGHLVGAYTQSAALRPEADRLFADWQAFLPGVGRYLVSGDSPTAAASLPAGWFADDRQRWRQEPQDKLHFVETLQADGHRVAMIGDGLNDAGALRQADVGISLTDDTAQFTPASDAILHGRALGQLPRFLHLSRLSLRIIRICFGVSVIYNIIGTTFAVQGELQPVIAAILMPFSSIGIIILATALTLAIARRVLRKEA